MPYPYTESIIVATMWTTEEAHCFCFYPPDEVMFWCPETRPQAHFSRALLLGEVIAEAGFKECHLVISLSSPQLVLFFIIGVFFIF